MRLIDECKKLRELEQHFSGLVQDANYLYYPDGDETVRCRGDLGGSMASGTGLAEMLCELRNLAPAMLEVLASFRAGDAEKLAWILSETIDNGSELRGMLERFQHMAALMEKEEQ